MPRNIRNTRRNFARPSDSFTPAASAGAITDVQGFPGATISVTKNSNPLGPGGNGTYVVTSIPSGLTGTTTSTATTASVSFGAPASTSAATFDIYISDANYNGNGKPIKVANPVTIPAAFQATLLVIAGGGGGGGASGGSQVSSGGGGGGGYRTFTGYNLTLATNYTVTVGAGGSAGQPGETRGSVGSNSIFSSATANGGGGGAGVSPGSQPALGGDGGSGGGGAGRNTVGPGNLGGSRIAITPFPTVETTTVQGNAGGGTTSNNVGSGGGGAGGAGQIGSGTGSQGGTSNNGLQSSITGTAVNRGGGGGGGGFPGGTGGFGGANGGGNNEVGANGTANTGGGGGGATSNNDNKAGGNGGSGVVILRYPNTRTITIGAGLTGSTSTDGSFRVTTITAGTGNVSFA